MPISLPSSFIKSYFSPAPPAENILARPDAPGKPADINSPWARVLQADFTKILRRRLSRAGVASVLRAYHFAFQKHVQQLRSSGDFYIIHPVSVASRCAEWGLDADTICAALLHDVVEDQGVSLSAISHRFGESVTELVDGVSKLDRIRFESQTDADAGNLSKMLMAMARDVRVMLIKLADRAHNMQTLHALPQKKRARIARETLEIYAPIANRLGLHFLYTELQDLSFQHLYPQRYRALQKAVEAGRSERQNLITEAITTVERALHKEKMRAELSGRAKELYAIYKKMRRKHCRLSDIHDVYGVRVVVNESKDCYNVLGLLHAIFKPLPGSFKDYIAIPKINGYQSLHTTLITNKGIPIEFQIRSKAMHNIAESGVAAHWIYKEKHKLFSLAEQNTMKWLQSVLELQQSTSSSSEFLENLKVDIFPESVYVFTPKGKIINLPQFATALDFAYFVHTEVGQQAQSCRINSLAASLATTLKNGDVIEILTSPMARPSAASLQYLRSARARTAVRHYLRDHFAPHAALAINGAEALGAQLIRIALTQKNEPPELLEVVSPTLLSELKINDLSTLYKRIATGQLAIEAVVSQILQIKKRTVIDEIAHYSLDAATPAVLQIDDPKHVLFHLTPCCNAIPGDNIYGLFRPTQGVFVHRVDCSRQAAIRQKNPFSIAIEWGAVAHKVFPCRFEICYIADLKDGMSKITLLINTIGITITGAELVSLQQGSLQRLIYTVSIKNRLQLAQLFRVLHREIKPQRLLRL